MEPLIFMQTNDFFQRRIVTLNHIHVYNPEVFDKNSLYYITTIQYKRLDIFWKYLYSSI